MKWFRAIFSVIILFSFLLSTNGFAVYKHYCGDYLVDFSLFSPAEGCCAKKDEACKKEESTKSCCEDETEFHKAEVELIKPHIAEISFHFYTLPFEINDQEGLRSFLSTPLINKERGPPLAEPPLYISLSRLTLYG